MKKITLTALLSWITITSFAQPWNIHSPEYIPEEQRKQIELQKKVFNAEQKAANWNFKKEGEKVYWQKVFEHPESDTLLVKEHFNNNPLFIKNNTGYTATIILTEYTDEPNMNIPFILHSPAELMFYVQFKNNRYRVTVEKSSWVGNAGTVGTITITQSVGLSLQDLKNKSGKFKQSGCKHTNICFYNLFNYKSKFNKKNSVLKEDF